MSRRVRGGTELEEATKTIAYEFDMLFGAMGLMGTVEDAEGVAGDQALNNAALESLLIHARNLREFFSPQGRRDTILARDFLDDRHPPGVSTPFLSLKASKDRLDQRLAHPSYKRPHHDRKWPIRKIMRELVGAMAGFLERLDQIHPHRREWFEGANGLVQAFRAEEAPSDLTST